MKKNTFEYVQEKFIERDDKKNIEQILKKELNIY